MKRILTKLFFIALIFLFTNTTYALKVRDLQNPQSIIIDPITGIYYISGYSDSTGFIWQVNPNGKRTTFIEGGKKGVELNSPKGLAIFSDQLYVADGKSIRRFDKTTGASLGIIDLLGINGNNLQRLAFSNDGQLFITDEPRNSIYKIDIHNAFKVSILIKSAKLSNPKGIVFDVARNQLIVSSKNHILSVSMDGKIIPIIKRTFQSLSGVCWGKQGNLLVSDQGAGKIYRIRNFSLVEIVQGNIIDPADISFDYTGNQILIPSTKGKLIFSLHLK
tara:strand:+ start:150 stop:977 length:828 start_codon:yes stop_codon:yes gene_type:complete